MSGPRLNPFQPDQPARVSIFTGRIAERELIRQTLTDTLRGRAAHVLMVGERGMGKTSLARFVADLAVSQSVLAGAGGVEAPAVLFVSLGFAPTVDEACAAILAEAYRWARERGSPLLRWFREELKNVEGIEIGPFGISRKLGDRSTALRSGFVDAIAEVKKEGAMSGLVIILDETEAISSDGDFPSFVKSTLETLTVRGHGDVELVLTMTPEGRDRAAAAHPSFLRLFRPVPIGPLSVEEVRELLHKTLAEGRPHKTAEADFVQAVAPYSSGIPSFVHEIGRAAFDVDADDRLTFPDFVAGLEGTADVVGAIPVLEQKHFRERYSQKVLSNTYRTILHAIARAEAELRRDDVTTEEIRARCPGVGQISPYLANMAKRGVVARADGKKGVYRLPDRMFGVFLRMADPRKPRARSS